MGWIVHDAVNRLRCEVGTYRWDQWKECADTVGVRIITLDADIAAWLGCDPAALVGRIVLVKDERDPVRIARNVWHEIGHRLLHAGGSDAWLCKPNGEILVRKFERQAREFADLFPIWD